MERLYVGAGFRVCWSFVVVVLLRCRCRVPAALAQSQAGFLNIDCGGTEKYVDPVTNFMWVPDAPYISTGKIQTTVVPASLQNFPEMKTLRYFDDTRPKNCYTLPVTAGSIYLLRVSLFYGDYDNANKPPSFQLALDAKTVDNVTASSGDGLYFEYHYVAQGNVTCLCLVRTSPLSMPFISGISLKPAGALSSGYNDKFGQYLQQGIIIKTLTRVNYGGTALIRSPDDFYDRFWIPDGPNSTYYLKPTTSPIEFLSTSSPFPGLAVQSDQPAAVMQTAVTSSGTIASFLRPQGSTGIVTSLYVSVYYGELNSSGTPRPRDFTVQIPDSTAMISMDGVFLHSGGWDFWPTAVSVAPNSTMTVTPAATSLAGPILNCMEVFTILDPSASKTIDRDALAIEEIKKSLNLKEWTGDPCLPSPHSWISCSSPDFNSPQPHITAVNLSGYELEGTIPASFANLWSLTSLSLDNNNLSGPIPDWLTTLSELRVLSVQNNNFSGPIPDALLSANSAIRFTYRPGNSLLTGGGPLPAPACSNCHGKSNVGAIVGSSIGGVLGLILILVIAIVAYRRCHRKPNLSDDQGAGGLMRIATTGGAQAYSFAQVTAATNHFNRELGKGGFGPVYYGKLSDGQEVAVKVADGSSKQGAREFFNEVDVLSRVHHKNLVALVGYCQEQKKILIYEYMHNGSLFHHLHGSSVSTVGELNWRMRLHIALNAAQGLEYLHTGCSPSFIHRDVKSSNILLTPKYDAKVADFGLTKLLGETENTRVITDVMGTAGYLDPEYYTTQYLSTKSDVYSFGIVLLELLTGRLPIDHSASTMKKSPNIAHWARESLQNSDIYSIMDPVVEASNPNIEAVWKVAEIAMQSVEPNSVHRPTMSEVVQELQGALMIEGPSTLHSQMSSRFLDKFLGASESNSCLTPR